MIGRDLRGQWSDEGSEARATRMVIGPRGDCAGERVGLTGACLLLRQVDVEDRLLERGAHVSRVRPPLPPTRANVCGPEPGRARGHLGLLAGRLTASGSCIGRSLARVSLPQPGDKLILLPGRAQALLAKRILELGDLHVRRIEVRRSACGTAGRRRVGGRVTLQARDELRLLAGRVEAWGKRERKAGAGAEGTVSGPSAACVDEQVVLSLTATLALLLQFGHLKRGKRRHLWHRKTPSADTERGRVELITAVLPLARPRRAVGFLF